jgi:hypothetical protein
MFVRVDGEDLARKVFRRTQNGIKCDGREREIKGVVNKIPIILREIFHRKL